MKRFVALALMAWLFVPAGAYAEGPDDDYVGIYNLIQQGDDLTSSGSPSAALVKYLEAQRALIRFQHVFPDWNPTVVNFRLRYLAAEVAALSGRSPQPAPPSATNAPNVAAHQPLP